MKYLIEYTEDHSNTVRFRIVEGNTTATWRELQEQHDPAWLVSCIKFYKLGDKLEYKQGE